MPKARGRTLCLSPAQGDLINLLRLARHVPAVPIERTLRVPPLTASLRATLVRAFAIVSADNPLLRRYYVPWPRPHLYEHPVTVAAIPVGVADELLSVRLQRPETMALADIETALARPDPSPPVGRWPRVLRRLWRRLGLGWSGRFHADTFGTFALSPYAGLDVDALHPLSLLAPTLHHGPIHDGLLRVRLVYDHRVLDGVSAAAALAQLAEVLQRDGQREAA